MQNPERQVEQVQRRTRVVDAARELAETEGWEAVSVRRVAEKARMSQPMVHAAFANRSEIVLAVALEGFRSLSGAMRSARARLRLPRRQLAAAVRAYLDFAAGYPAVYEAMFDPAAGLLDTRGGTEAIEVEAALSELHRLVAQVPTVRPPEAATMTELLIASLHGLAVLERSGRLRPDERQARLDLLVERFTA